MLLCSIISRWCGFEGGFCGFTLALYITLCTADRMSPFRWDRHAAILLPEATAGSEGLTPVCVCSDLCLPLWPQLLLVSPSYVPQCAFCSSVHGRVFVLGSFHS